MDNNISVLKQNRCTGCMACVHSCPKKAISMVENDEGFLYPVIDKSKCIECGICKKKCPILNFEKKESTDYPIAYAAKLLNKKELMKCSSGGVFTAIAKYVLKNKGIVFGAAYNDDMKVEHVEISSSNELIKLNGSKYVQSNVNDTYKKVQQYLKEKKLVLFTGTPCQIAGLKSFLTKDYENLITCDLVCHGVPSQKIFKKYIQFLENKFDKKIIKYDFRNKEKKGWGLTAKVIFDDNSVKYINADFDGYYSNFLDCNIYRESCYLCPFASKSRLSDITLADYWGVLSIHNDFYDKNGVSLILVNSIKGENILSKISKNVELLKTDLDYAISKNKNISTPSIRPDIRDTIYLNMDDELYIQNNLKVKITPKKIVKIFIPNKLKKLLMKLKGR